MKCYNVMGVIVIVLCVSNVVSEVAFNDHTACNRVEEESASREVCNGVHVEMDYMYCCYVTYKDKHTDTVRNLCRLIEITEDALNKFKNTLDMHSDVSILCESAYVSLYSYFVYVISIIFLLI